MPETNKKMEINLSSEIIDIVDKINGIFDFGNLNDKKRDDVLSHLVTIAMLAHGNNTETANTWHNRFIERCKVQYKVFALLESPDGKTKH